ncbi:MAG TPA: malonyl-CoA synthase [Casimicrobiaceae bacterium]|nr:malonyl-CoA synthase [Casimicrobiaceae bacterium]
MNANLYALFESHFPKGDAQACLIVHGRAPVDYDELATLSARIANALVAAGCKPGDRVAVQVDKHWQALALYLATLRAGLVYLPLNTAYRRAELDYFFDDARPRVIVCEPERLGVIETLARGATVLTLDAEGGNVMQRARESADAFTTVARGPDDLAAILYTSGTTGRSKGAMLTHRNLASNALALVDAWSFTRGDVLLHALPIYHVHGLFVAVHCALLSASRMIWLPKFDAREVASLLPRATVMMGVPTFYTRLLREPLLDRGRVANIRLFVSGSAPLLIDTFTEFEARTGHRILERYGMTETGMNTSNPLHGERKAGTVGPSLPGVSIRVVDTAGDACNNGAIGAVEVRGPNVCAGYWNQPDKTAEATTADGWFRTGDLGSLDAGGYLTICGRAKDMIISGGLNVYPKEIEERIDALPGVVESAVVGIPDADFGEAVVAVVIARGDHAFDEAGVIAALKQNIARFKVPKRVIFVDELPRNAMGKVQKNLLRERYSTSGHAPETGPTL